MKPTLSQLAARSASKTITIDHGHGGLTVAQLVLRQAADLAAMQLLRTLALRGLCSMNVSTSLNRTRDVPEVIDLVQTCLHTWTPELHHRTLCPANALDVNRCPVKDLPGHRCLLSSQPGNAVHPISVVRPHVVQASSSSNLLAALDDLALAPGPQEKVGSFRLIWLRLLRHHLLPCGPSILLSERRCLFQLQRQYQRPHQLLRQLSRRKLPPPLHLHPHPHQKRIWKRCTRARCMLRLSELRNVVRRKSKLDLNKLNVLAKKLWNLK